MYGRRVAIKLHRCPFMFLKSDGHACWRVQKALDEEGIDYEVVKAPLLKPRRKRVQEISGQGTVPTIEFEDGTGYREESVDMAARIRDGRLFENAATD
jgi:glutathione S-transferase